jgi:hypothetical protein
LSHQHRAGSGERSNQEIDVFFIFECLIVKVGRSKEKRDKKLVGKKGKVQGKRKGIKEHQEHNQKTCAPVIVPFPQEEVEKDEPEKRNSERRYSKDPNGKTEEFCKAGSPPYLEDEAHGRPGGKAHLPCMVEGFSCFNVRPVIVNGVVLIGAEKNPEEHIYSNQNHNGYV